MRCFNYECKKKQKTILPKSHIQKLHNSKGAAINTISLFFLQWYNDRTQDAQYCSSPSPTAESTILIDPFARNDIFESASTFSDAYTWAFVFGVVLFLSDMIVFLFISIVWWYLNGNNSIFFFHFS